MHSRYNFPHTAVMEAAMKELMRQNAEHTELAGVPSDD